MAIRVVTFHYTLTDKTGKVLDSSSGKTPLSYMEGSGQIIPGLEKQLAGLKKGEKKKIAVPAAEAYGVHDERKVLKVPRQQLPTPDVKLGDRFAGGPGPEAPVFKVTELGAAEVTLDGNHPLAGVDLTFDIEMTDLREATTEEIAHGHAHGEHGHSH
jgi:FKBP-type peptidyl-prolyl cis-trans isomerase SlyD